MSEDRESWIFHAGGKEKGGEGKRGRKRERKGGPFDDVNSGGDRVRLIRDVLACCEHIHPPFKTILIRYILLGSTWTGPGHDADGSSVTGIM